ncbi:MAG TPA: hypothetical protein VF883_12735 [Thermoanaerobaculia bacterium]|jgi:hypothetical protein
MLNMQITIHDREAGLRERLRKCLEPRLERAAGLRCNEHGETPVAVAIHGRENGWFDSRWTTCCEGLEQQAVAIVKERC